MRVNFWHDWQFRGVNWLNATVISLDYERDYSTGTSEVHMALVGLHIRVSWVHDQATLDSVNLQMSRWMAEHFSSEADDDSLARRTHRNVH